MLYASSFYRSWFLTSKLKHISFSAEWSVVLVLCVCSSVHCLCKKFSLGTRVIPQCYPSTLIRQWQQTTLPLLFCNSCHSPQNVSPAQQWTDDGTYSIHPNHHTKQPSSLLLLLVWKRNMEEKVVLWPRVSSTHLEVMTSFLTTILRQHSITHLWTGRKCVVHWYIHDPYAGYLVYTGLHADKKMG